MIGVTDSYIVCVNCYTNRRNRI